MDGRARENMGQVKPLHSVIRVAIVDDHAIVRAGLAALVRDEPELCVCGEAATPDDAVKLAQAANPDVMLVDLSLGEASGLDLIRRLNGQAVRVLVVSVHKDPTWAERSLASGARGYVHKGDAAQDMVRAIHCVHGGQTWVSPSMVMAVAAGSQRHSDGRPISSRVEALSDRELEVCERIGKGLSTRQIGDALGLSPKTVQTYREHLKIKLGCDTSAELAARAARWCEART